MGREINEAQIRDLDKKIEGAMEDTIPLKRRRNSLLNISTRVPPEILGRIFHWRVIPNEDRPYTRGLPKGSHNFRLVCHHWFEVAARAPELWGYWGNTLEKWLQFYRRSGATPVDLVLDGDHTGDSKISFDGPLRDAVRERVKLDAIRSIYLRSKRKPLLDSIRSALTPDGEGVRRSSIELISSQHVDVSAFLIHHHFPKLRYLHLAKFQSPPWEHLGQHTTALTNLSISLNNKASSPTMTQLLSILASNPRLQILALSKWAIPRDSGDGSAVPVPLRYLERLSIDANVHPVFRLLPRLECPERMDEMNLTVFGCTVEDVLGTLGPCLRDHIQRDGRFRDGLGVFVESSCGSITIEASTVKDVELPQSLKFATFTAFMREDLPPLDEDQMCVDLVAHTPVEHVVYFEGDLGTEAIRRAIPTMPNIRDLVLINPLLQDGFLQPDPEEPFAGEKFLPSLQRLSLKNVVLGDRDWQPFLRYLAHQTSNGRQWFCLSVSAEYEQICEKLVKEMERLTEELDLDVSMDEDCPCDHCLINEEDDYE